MGEDAEPPESDDTSELLPIRTCSGVTVVGGELDMATVPLLREALQTFVRTGGQVRINLHDITFIDSSGLHLLIDTAATLGTTGRVVVIDPSPVVRRLVGITGLRLDVDMVGPGRPRAA